MNQVSVPNLRWYDNQPKEIAFPDHWDVEIFESAGLKKEAITDEAVSSAFAKPIASPHLEELAKDAEDAVIIFDDITRPTPISRVLPWVLRALEKGGIKKDNIRLIPGLGSHGAMNYLDFRKKLGDWVVENYEIYNHNVYENCAYIGTTEKGTPVYLNKEFVSADVKIAIGAIFPHHTVGFGGGGKLIFPGIGGIESLEAFHRVGNLDSPRPERSGSTDGNVRYNEVLEIVQMSGLQVKIDCLINGRGEITDLFVGNPLKVHKAGVEVAQDHCAIKRPAAPKDVVVVNAYAKPSESFIALEMAETIVNKKSGVIVAMVDAPEGQVCHYLFGKFGHHSGGRLQHQKKIKPRPADENLSFILLSQFPDRNMQKRIAAQGPMTVARTWDDAFQKLDKKYPDAATAGVILDGTMQYFT